MKILAQLAAYFGLVLIVQVALHPEPNSPDHWAITIGCALLAFTARFALDEPGSGGKK